VVFFVNSGSEANDLALRLARAANRRGSERCLVVEHAYHGHTVSVLGLSPYKYEHSSFGGKGKPSWVTKCVAPDTYRGPHRGPDAGAKYAASVEDACKAAGAEGVCAFFIESGMSVAGVLVPPKGYLAACYAAVRCAGGVCIADEVQTGVGRVGDHWWAFEQQGVVPDIVTMGKPFGNGMPLAAVVCTRALSDAFASAPNTSTRLVATRSARRPDWPCSGSSSETACVRTRRPLASGCAARCARSRTRLLEL